MIYLNTSTRSLQAVLGAAVSTSQIDVTACFYDTPNRPRPDNAESIGAAALTTTANTTAVIAVAAPPPDTTRNIGYLSFFNADTTTAALTVKYNDNGTTRVLQSRTLAIKQALAYETDTGWYLA